MPDGKGLPVTPLPPLQTNTDMCKGTNLISKQMQSTETPVSFNKKPKGVVSKSGRKGGKLLSKDPTQVANNSMLTSITEGLNYERSNRGYFGESKGGMSRRLIPSRCLTSQCSRACRKTFLRKETISIIKFNRLD